jgi:hypothetical protein
MGVLDSINGGNEQLKELRILIKGKLGDLHGPTNKTLLRFRMDHIIKDTLHPRKGKIPKSFLYYRLNLIIMNVGNTTS